MTIGTRIAAARQERGLTQDELADAAGVSRSAVAQWETDRSAPAITTLPRVARALSTTADDLLGDPDTQVATSSRLSIRNLSVLAYANGFTLWHYKAQPDERQEGVLRRGYFNAAADMLAAGDMILLSTQEGGRVVCVANDDADVVLVGMS